jgi:integral membrane protein
VTLFRSYRVLALVVGVLLLVGTVDAVLKYGFSDGSGPQQLGEDLDWVWMIHGWIYIVYVVVAFVLTQKANWTLPRFGLLMVAGLIPGLIFWVERKVTRQLREEHPELAGVSG